VKSATQQLLDAVAVKSRFSSVGPRSAVAVLAAGRGADPFAAADPVHAQVAHQAVYGAERDPVTLAARVVVIFPAAVEAFGVSRTLISRSMTVASVRSGRR